MEKALKLVVAGILVVAATATAAAAQDASAQVKPAATLAAGYQFQRISDTNMAKGGFVDLSFGRRDVEGVVQVGASFKSTTSSFSAGSFSGSSERTLSLSRLMGGVRLRTSGAKAMPFIHALGGLIRAAVDGTSTSTSPGGTQNFSFDESDSEAAIQFGLGVDIKVSNTMGVRLGGDYVRVLSEGGSNVWLASAGVTFGLGRR